jgi:hypothetical protein
MIYCIENKAEEGGNALPERQYPTAQSQNFRFLVDVLGADCTSFANKERQAKFITTNLFMHDNIFQFLEESMTSLSFKLIKICIEIGGTELAEFRISLDYQIDRSIIWLFRESSAVGLPAPVRLPPASCPLLFFIPLGLPPALSSVDTSIFACGLSVLL